MEFYDLFLSIIGINSNPITGIILTLLINASLVSTTKVSSVSPII